MKSAETPQKTTRKDSEDDGSDSGNDCSLADIAADRLNVTELIICNLNLIRLEINWLWFYA